MKINKNIVNSINIFENIYNIYIYIYIYIYILIY